MLIILMNTKLNEGVKLNIRLTTKTMMMTIMMMIMMMMIKTQRGFKCCLCVITLSSPVYVSEFFYIIDNGNIQM